jgi:hypothetical protein
MTNQRKGGREDMTVIAINGSPGKNRNRKYPTWGIERASEKRDSDSGQREYGSQSENDGVAGSGV